MADDVKAPAKPDTKAKGKGGMSKPSIFGMPQWLVIAGGAMLVAVGYMYWRNKQVAASNASTAAANTTATTQYGATGGGQDEELYSQLLNLQQQLGNMSNQATVPGYSVIPWESTGDTGDMSLNALADYVNSTPQAIIDNTKAAYAQNGTGWDFNTALGDYFNTGTFDQPIPQGYLLYVPILAPTGKGAPLGGQSGDVVPPVSTGYYSPPQPAGGF